MSDAPDFPAVPAAASGRASAPGTAPAPQAPPGAAAPAASAPDPSITIWHNPACGTSRNALELIRSAGIEPTVVEYLKTPPGRAKLAALAAALGTPVRGLLRRKGTPHDELGLDDPKWSDDELIDFMVAHPILMNRPIVETPLGTRLCRPSEAVLDLLPAAQRGAFAKEDGEAVVDAQGDGWSPAPPALDSTAPDSPCLISTAPDSPCRIGRRPARRARSADTGSPRTEPLRISGKERASS